MNTAVRQGRLFRFPEGKEFKNKGLAQIALNVAMRHEEYGLPCLKNNNVGYDKNNIFCPVILERNHHRMVYRGENFERSKASHLL